LVRLAPAKRDTVGSRRLKPAAMHGWPLSGPEASLGIPLPPATQWEIVKETADVIQPAFDELIRQAAQGEVLYNDDTAMKVLALALARASPHTTEGEEEPANSR